MELRLRRSIRGWAWIAATEIIGSALAVVKTREAREDRGCTLDG